MHVVEFTSTEDSATSVVDVLGVRRLDAGHAGDGTRPALRRLAGP